MKLFEVQDKLPNLPVPDLTQSCSMFLASVEPLVTPEEFKHTTELIQDFIKAGGTGEKLQKLLEARAEECNAHRGKTNPNPDEFSHPDGTLYPHNHWLEYWWETYAYMSDRSPLALLVNCWQSNFSSLPCERPLERAAWMIVGSLDFKRLLDTEEVPAEGAGKSMFCSAQYLRIIGSTRVPGKEVDRMMTHPKSDHICVERKGHWYLIDKISSLNPAEVQERLELIKADADSRPYGPGVAAFTGDDRTAWANNREALVELNPQNKGVLEKIENAVLHMVLCEANPESLDELQIVGAHGNGSQLWFDKSVTIIVCENGRVISNLEHASADAVVPARMYAYVDEFVHKNAPEGNGFHPSIPYKEGVALMQITKYVQPAPSGIPAKAERIDFILNGDLEDRLVKAKAVVQNLIDDHVITCLKFTDFGAATLRKKCKGISSDSFIQMSLALAYYRDQGNQVPASYETATTRSFFHARTETIRSQSKHSKAFCEAFARGETDKVKLAGLIRKAGDHHRNYLRACMAGKGCDRHLMGLKIIGAENGISHPLFEDVAYTQSTSFQLSTSQMPWAIESYPAFGAYSPDAYGVCYRLTNCDTIVATVTSRNRKVKDARRFKEAIYQAFRDIFAVLEANPPPPKGSKL